MTRGVPEPTARLRFREYSEGDVGLVAGLFADPLARRFYPDMVNEEKLRSWIDWNLANYRDHGFGLWVLEHIESGLPLGDCGLTLQDVAGEEMVEVGYHLTEGHRGLGYATEAAAACLAYAFDALGVEAVCSIVDPENRPSIAVASHIHDGRTTFTRADGKRMLLFTSPAPR